MNTKTMEGLIGASVNRNLRETPFKVYKEARREGNTAVMERSMGYVEEFSEKVEEYKAKADKGMEEETEAARENAKKELEKAIQKRREERENFEKRIEASGEGDLVQFSGGNDTLQISEEGRLLLEENHMGSENMRFESATVSEHGALGDGSVQTVISAPQTESDEI